MEDHEAFGELVKRVPGYLDRPIEELVKMSAVGSVYLSTHQALLRKIKSGQLGLAEEDRKTKLAEGQAIGKALLDVEGKIGELLPAVDEARKTAVSGQATFLLARVDPSSQDQTCRTANTYGGPGGGVMTYAEQFRAHTGAEILLTLEHTGELPLHDRNAVGETIHHIFVTDGWDSQLAQNDIYGTKLRSCPHYWSLGRLDNICEELRKRGYLFKYLKDFGWGFLHYEEAQEWRRGKDRATETAVKTRNKVVRVINDKWPSSSIAPLELQQKRIGVETAQMKTRKDSTHETIR